MANDASPISVTTVPDAASYGVTGQGFVVKPLQAILTDTFARARQLFGPDIDLRSSSASRKMIELACLNTALIWMTLDDVYHSGFTSTASASALDLLGADLGLDRANLTAIGRVTFKLTSAAPANSVLTLPPGTLVETIGAEPVEFRLTAILRLSNDPGQPWPAQADAPVVAVTPGSQANIAAGQVMRIEPTFAARYLSFDPSYQLVQSGAGTTARYVGFDPSYVAISNAAPFSGGELYEDDSTYRRKLQARPRTLWTPDAIRETVYALDGVRDVLVSEPYGGLDTSVAYGDVCFGDTVFQAPRNVGNPYFFSITVAALPGVIWNSEGSGPDQVVGLRDQILAAIEPIRPISTFPRIVQADLVEVAVRARLTLQPGTDSNGLRTAAMTALDRYITGLRLGDAVLYSQVLRALTELPGVSDVQNLRLRRNPPRFGEVVFGAPVVYADPSFEAALEAGCGENLTLANTEVAVLADANESIAPAGGAGLFDLEVEVQ